MRLLALIALITSVVWITGAGASQTATYFSHEKVDEALAHDSSFGDLFTAPDFRILVHSRTTPGVVEIHENETDVFYLVNGWETMVTGGTVVGGKKTGPGQIRGEQIQGGDTRHLMKGDLIVLPAGTPHWIREVPTSIADTPRWINVKGITSGPSSGPVAFLGHEKVAEALAKNRLLPGLPGNPALLTTSDLRVNGNYRTVPGEVEVHETETEIDYVLEGTATMVTGGTVVGGKTIRPGEIRGSSIQGGQTQRLTKGDMMLLPAGTPHWDKEIAEKYTYMAVKVPKR